MVITCIPMFGHADGGNESPSKLTPGDYSGEYEWKTIIGGTVDRKCEVTVTIGDDGRINKLNVTNPDVPYQYKSQYREFEKNAIKHFIGKDLKYILKMDMDNACGAHVSGNKDIVESPTHDNAAPAKVVQMAVLNALKYDTTVQSNPDTDKKLEGVARIPRYNYEQRVTVTVNQQGRIVDIDDSKTDNQTNWVTTDNQKRYKLFRIGRGKNKFIGKNAAEIKAMDIGKHGVDSVSGATFTSIATREAVLDALDKGNIPEGTFEKEDMKEFEGTSTKTSQDIEGNKIKVKIYLDKNNRIGKIENNNSYPNEKQTSGTQTPWSKWDNFARYRGFYKFIGMSKQEVEKADTTSKDSIYVAFKQTELSTMTKEAILDAFAKAEQQELKEKLEKVKKELTEEINNAENILSEIKVSKDGKDIKKTERWATEESKKKFHDAIKTAKNIDSEEPKAYEDGKAALIAAKDAFNKATKYGLKGNKIGQDSQSQKKLKKIYKKLKVKRFKVKAIKRRKFRLIWKKESRATGYQIQFRLSYGKKYKTLKTIKSTKTISKKLKKGKRYKFRIRTYKVVNGTKIYGKWTYTSKIRCK